MKQRLTWRDIENFYSGQWVELVDFDWQWNKPFPVLARVKNYANSRSELLAKLGGKSREIESESDSVVLYVGSSKSMVQLEARLASF